MENKTPKRSKELSKQDKDGNPIWLKPERSKELEEILAIFEIGVRALALRNVEFKSLADEVRDEAITAIEKWAKEKYAPKNS